MRRFILIAGLLLPWPAFAQTIVDMPPPSCPVNGPCTLSTLALTGQRPAGTTLAAPAGAAGRPAGANSARAT